MLRFLKRFLKVLLGLAGGVLLVSVILVFLLHWDGDRRIHLEKEALRHAGAPLSIAAWSQSQIPADANAFPHVEDMAEFLDRTPAVGELWENLNDISPRAYLDYLTLYTFEENEEATWISIRQLLEAEGFDEFFARIGRITELSSFHPDWEEQDNPIHWFVLRSTLQSVHRTLLIDGAVAAHFGDSERAIRRIEQSAALSDLTLEAGTLIGAMTASSLRSQTLVACEGLSRKLPGSLGRVELDWGNDYSDAWEAILHTERLLVLAPRIETLLDGSEPEFRRYFNLDYEYPEGSGMILPGLSVESVHDALRLLHSYPVRWIVKYSYAETLSAMNEALELAPLSYHEIRQKYPDQLQTESTRNPLVNLIPAITIESLIKIREKLALSDTRTRLAQIAQALRAYREARGAFPEELKALQPEYFEDLPTDLFSGECFIYRRTGEGFALYSVGQNQKDDGGVYDMYYSDPAKSDLIWSGYGSNGSIQRDR